ncbi:hypothetical protein O2W14_00475 [Modestobacter sp. VKM Ac-2986]|uniref:hypothetical protein n=1 Tax=Modestobacter sp. VKM Ac-2986 TaxID=3004140 RepID=UPI0022AACDD3|nr:hypothetical protein [Modestobacter sp. VKM Ac-2986]MCZ2827307.1 hypothetical protein [Modestobacter sp. VKM Ac-2986]
MAARKGSGKQAPSGSVGHGEFVAYPGGPTAIYDLLERLSEAAADAPEYGTPGISLDRKRLTVRWFGEPPAAVQRVLDSAEGFELTVARTEFRPADLRAEAGRLLAEHPGLVTSARERPEGDGIDVLVAPPAAEAAGGAGAALEQAGVRAAFPLVAEAGEAPAP